MILHGYPFGQFYREHPRVVFIRTPFPLRFIQECIGLLICDSNDNIVWQANIFTIIITEDSFCLPLAFLRNRMDAFTRIK